MSGAPRRRIARRTEVPEWEHGEVRSARLRRMPGGIWWIVPGVAVAASGMLLLLGSFNVSNRVVPRAGELAPLILDLGEEEGGAYAGPVSPKEIGGRAKALLGRFFDPEAATWEEREAMVVAAKAAMIEEYYARPGKALRPLVRFHDLRAVDHDGRRLLVCRAADVDGGEMRALLELIGEEVKLHWLPTVGYGEMAWGKFVDAKPEVPVQMRMKLHAVGLEKEAAVHGAARRLVVSHPDLDRALVAEASDEAESGYGIPERDPSEAVPVNAMIRWSDERPGRPVIVSILHPGWMR